jgi:hypothetical protein
MGKRIFRSSLETVGYMWKAGLTHVNALNPGALPHSRQLLGRNGARSRE